MKLLLVVPNFRWCESDKNTLWHYIPYNLCLLASVVKNMCDVSILDAYKDDLTQKEFLRKLKIIKPDMVGITVLFDQYGESGHIAAKLAKKVKARTAFGGVYATTNWNKVRKDKNVDVVVVGEGEQVIKHIVWDYEKGLFDTPIYFADKIKDLDTLPFPAYDRINYSKYSESAERKSVDSPRDYPFARIMTSRGCPIGCAFCQVETIMGKDFRPRSPRNVLNEIEWLKQAYGVKSLIFDDDNLLFDKNRAKEIFQGMIDRNLVMPWVSIGLAVFKLDNELLDLMRKSGCEYIAVAIESGNKRVLRQIINKPVSFDYAKEMVKYARSLGIYVAANFIVGFPTETWDEIRETLKFAEEIDVDYAKIFHAVPLPHTRLYELCEQEKAFKGNNRFVWSKGNIETGEFTSDDLTILRAYEWDRINFTNPEKRAKTAMMMGVSEEELSRTRKDTLKNACKLIGVN